MAHNVHKQRNNDDSEVSLTTFCGRDKSTHLQLTIGHFPQVSYACMTRKEVQTLVASLETFLIYGSEMMDIDND